MLRNPFLPALNDREREYKGVGGSVWGQEKQYTEIRVPDGKANCYPPQDDESQLQDPYEIQWGLILFRSPFPLVLHCGIFWSSGECPVPVCQQAFAGFDRVAQAYSVTKQE